MNLGKKDRKGKQIESDHTSDEFDNEDMEIIKALLAKRATKGKGKDKARVPQIFFSCDKFSTIAAKLPNKDDKDEKNFNKYKGKKDFKSYKSCKDKGKKSCYIAKYFDSDED